MFEAAPKMHLSIINQSCKYEGNWGWGILGKVEPSILNVLKKGFETLISSFH